MKSYKLVVILLAIGLVLLSALMLIYNFYFISEVKTLNMTFQTADKMGINTQIDALYFGKNYPGSISMREINLTNNKNYPVYVTIKVEGSLAEFVSVSDNNFILGPLERKHILYYVQTKKDTPYQNFTGVTKIVIRRVLFK